MMAYEEDRASSIEKLWEDSPAYQLSGFSIYGAEGLVE